MSDEDNTTGEIERELDDTRSRLDATIGALQQKLSPGSMVDEAVNYFKEGGGVEFTSNLGRSMRDNPVPVALIGIGVAWLMVGGARRSSATAGWQDRSRPGVPGYGRYRSGGRSGASMGMAAETSPHQPMPYEAAARDDLAIRAHEAGAALHRYADENDETFQGRVDEARGTVLGITRQAGEAAEGFRRRIEDAMSSAKASVGSMLSGAGDMAGDLADRGQSAARQLYDYGASATSGVREMGGRTVDYVQEQPLLLGALGLAVGAVIGLMVPATRYERRVAGSLRHQLGETASELASDARDRAMRVADTVMDAARDASQREGLTPPEGGVVAAARDKAHDVADRARRVVEETASAGRDAVRQEFAGGDDKNRHREPAAAGTPATGTGDPASRPAGQGQGVGQGQGGGPRHTGA